MEAVVPAVVQVVVQVVAPVAERAEAQVAVLGAPAVAAVLLVVRAALVVVQAQAEPRLPAATRWFWTWMVTASKPQAPGMARSSCSITMPMV